jgi:hypothetical protein
VRIASANAAETKKSSLNVVFLSAELDFLVATNRTAIVATIEQAWNRILLARQRILQLSGQ